MPFVKFIEDRETVEAVPQVFKGGRVYELPEASCDRWKRRGAAVDATAAEIKGDDKPATKPAKKPA